MSSPLKYIALLTIFLFSSTASAYIGPGAGISFLGSLVTALWAVVLAFAAILFWPVRYLFRRLRKKKAPVAKRAATD
jgi:hypothetical protein